MNKNKILFVIDDLEYMYFEFNKLVTNFWLIKEFLARSFDVFVTTKNKLSVVNRKASAQVNKALLTPDENIVYEEKLIFSELETFEVVFFRPDPPVDVDYINACNVFEYVDKAKTLLINNPLMVRNFNEKLSVNLFKDFVPNNIVTSNKMLIIDFVKKYSKAVIKPLNRCFGSGVFILDKNDANLSSIINSVTDNEKTMVMVQEYLDGAINGDKRVLIIGDKVYDEAVIKIPPKDDFKFAQHSDEFFRKAPLTAKEKAVAQEVASQLNKKELYMVGLDMIDEKVIEINVTSPCYFIKEINDLYGIKFENIIMDDILSLINQVAIV